MGGVAAGAFTAAAAAVLCEEVEADAVGLDSHRVADAVVGGGAHAAAALEQFPAAQDVAPDDLAEGVAELPDAVGVDEGVDDRVGVGEDDGHVEGPEGRVGTLGAEQGEAVDEVQRQPANGKQAHDDSQRLGRLDLLLEG